MINDWRQATAGTINIDWLAVEEKLGFALHDNLKDLYSRILCPGTSKGRVEGVMEFNPLVFVKENINRESWLEGANGESEYAQFELFPLKQADKDYVCSFLEEAFSGDWTGGNDFGHRAYIGELLINIGQITLIFNNDTGRFEWVDFGYGYFEVYEENPYGIVADTVQEFLDKFIVDEEAMAALAELYDEEDE